MISNCLYRSQQRHM